MGYHTVYVSHLRFLRPAYHQVETYIKGFLETESHNVDPNHAFLNTIAEIVENEIPFNLMYSTCLYLNQQRRYDFSKCVLNSKFLHFTKN